MNHCLLPSIQDNLTSYVESQRNYLEVGIIDIDTYHKRVALERLELIGRTEYPTATQDTIQYASQLAYQSI